MGIETLNEDLELNIPMFDDDMDIISKLDDEPNAVGGLTAAELKAEFDRPGKTIQKYLNETLVPSLIGTVAEESVRAQNEYIRVTNENQRIINEEVREEAETAREQAEKEREKTIKLISDLTVSADTLPAGEKAQVEKTVENGAYSLKLKIPEGKSGRDGVPGEDGVSPVATVESIEGGHRVTITDAEGPKSFDVMNGKDGSGTGGGSGGGVSKASELENDVPFVSAVEQSLTDDQKAQARVNIGAATVEIEYQNIGSASFVLFDITDGNGESHHLQWSKDPAKPKDGGVWVPRFNEETSMLEWDYYQADALYPVPMPTPVGIPIPDKTSDLENDSEFVELPTMQQSIQQVYDTTNVFIPQNPTEEQKAQARENIGVENVLESIGGDTLTWDGNTEGLVSAAGVFFKVSDAVVPIGLNATATFNDGESYTGDIFEGVPGVGVVSNGEAVFIIHENAANVDIEGFIFPEPGVYVYHEDGVFISSLTIPGYTGFAKKQIKEEYIPESIPQVQTAAVGQTIVVSEVDAEGKPTKWEARDVGSGGTTTQMVSTTVTVGTEPVILDDTAPEQEVLLAWDAPGARTVPAFTNYYIPRSNISYPRTFNANAYTQFASNSAAHGNADTFVAGHTYFQALRYEMDGESFAMLYGLDNWFADVEYGSADATANGSIRLTGRGWVYTLTTPGAVGQFVTRFNADGSGTGTVRYLYCIDVTALAESGVIESTSVAYLAELFGGLELVPGQNFEGASYGNSMKLTITRGAERIEVDGGTDKTTVIGGDALSTDVGKVTFILKVPKTVSTNGGNGSVGCDWSGKKWVAFGDSLTDETINANKKYYRHIAEKTGINVVVMGVGGTGYAKNYGEGTSYGERMALCPSDADVITIFGSINDWNPLNSNAVQIGSPSDSLDAGTYSGYVNNCIDVAISKAPYTQIALVAPMFYRGIKPEIQESISSALKAVAEYRRIKFLDLYHDSGFRIENDTFAQAYTTDYSATAETFGHPSNLAHEQLIAPEFMELLRRMLLS